MIRWSVLFTCSQGVETPDMANSAPCAPVTCPTSEGIHGQQDNPPWIENSFPTVQPVCAGGEVLDVVIPGYYFIAIWA